MRITTLAMCVAICVPAATAAGQREQAEASPTTTSAPADASAPATVNVTRQSRESRRTSCPANTSSGAQPHPPSPREPTERVETWSEFDPAAGFLLAPTNVGELPVSTYALLRYAGFDNSSEYLAGPPVGSTFGYYATGQDGTAVSAAFSVFS